MDQCIEKIGKVTLDYSLYPGEDYYCDGDVEDEILDIVKKYSQVEYAREIENRKSWPILYHLSPLRENIVEWLPIDKEMKVLEVGSGCGAITGALSKKAGEVTCIDLSKKRSLINAYRHMDCDNVTIHVGNFKDVEKTLTEKYDFICLIGVFEYGQAYIGGETPFEDFLNILKKHLAKDGTICIAIENKLGLKYFAGCREDHLGTFFSGIEDYPDGGVVRTFSRDGLLDIAKKCGFQENECQMYYPYPDYKFMHTLFSDRRLPHVGECKDNLRNFDRDRLLLFDEKLVFDMLIREEKFIEFSNSYMLLLGMGSDVAYARYSNDRDEATQIVTTMKRGSVSKRALSREGSQHINNMLNNYELLKARYEGSKLQIAACYEVCKDEEVAFPYAKGISLEELLDEKLRKNDKEGFKELFLEYVDRISFGEDKNVTDYDLIFSNILVNGDDWVVIDYEWTIPEWRDSKEIAFRALYCYLLEDEQREKCEASELFAALGLTDSQIAEYRENEVNFQKRVTRNHMSMGQIREAIGNECIGIDAFSSPVKKNDLRDKLQVYVDEGKGFLEETSFFPEGEVGFYSFKVSALTKLVRIDPCSKSCIVNVKSLICDGKNLELEQKKYISVNGNLFENVVVYATEDPQLTVNVGMLREEKKAAGMLENPYADIEFELEISVTDIDSETAGKIRKKGIFGR